jgi:hypothetical protein
MMEDKGFKLFQYLFLVRIQVSPRKTLFRVTLIQLNLNQKKYQPQKY